MTPRSPAHPKRRRRETAELSRQGAKSAARGDSPPVNPMDATENTPPSTGESVEEWRARRDAWQAGYDQQSEAIEQSRPPAGQGRDDEHD
ncbi:CrpP-related protein [Piscinibacter gummiphilus]|uniref:CrpP-related protein n=1 Tax=Piscinibacter gummiphilus TaxID=946333 RepID=A0ABZ0CYW6_9BURK|nr:CrpP-related protein [Piscinibacter gummiphilus]WOB10150.1 CrpP-related protein [Piscinibacter gummiphilus]